MLSALSLGSMGVIGVSSVASAGPTHSAPLVASQILLGSSLSHTFTPLGAAAPVSEPLSNIDDLTRLDDNLFVVFQNGVGSMGEASTSKNLDGTVVEFTTSGHVLGQWDVPGRTDGMVADPQLNGVIVTVNEDGNSSLYVIQPSGPSAGQITHYNYAQPLAHGGGTDSIAIVHDQILISASAPGTMALPAPNATFPAVYAAQLNASTMTVALSPLFFGEDVASVANVGPTYGTPTNLALTDPDSSTVVPKSYERFAGEYEVTSQGDQQQIFVRDAGSWHQSLTVLTLAQSVDDTAFATDHDGLLYSTDAANNSVDSLSGWLSTWYPYTVATPCSANSAPTPCTAPNYLANINLWTGSVSAVTVSGAPYTPKGALIFVGDEEGEGLR